MAESVIPSAWLGQPSEVVAPALLGCHLVRQYASGHCHRGVIVETEAYAPGDPACHAYRRQTARNAVMFGPAGYCYVYLIYGMYFCLNVVTDQSGVGSAVLVRALALDTIPDWVPEKKRRYPHRVAAGPGLLCQTLHINRDEHNGLSLQPQTGEAIWLEFPQDPLPSNAITQTTRIGITRGVDIPWRWYVKGDPAVSRFK